MALGAAQGSQHTRDKGGAVKSQDRRLSVLVEIAHGGNGGTEGAREGEFSACGATSTLCATRRLRM